MRAGDRADHVEGVIDIGDPVAHRLVQRVLQRLGAGMHGYDLGAHQLHAIDVGRLALDVLGAHVDHALEAQPRGDRGRGHAMLAGAGFRDDAGLAQVLRQQGLADGVVDLVRAGVVQVLALEPDLRAVPGTREALGVIQRRRSADVVLEVVVQLGDEGGVVLQLGVGLFQTAQRLHQGLGHEASTIGTEMALGVRVLVGL